MDKTSEAPTTSQVSGITNRGSLPRIVMSLSSPTATTGWARFERFGCRSKTAVFMSVSDARTLAEKVLAGWPFGGEIVEEYHGRRLRFLIIRREDPATTKV